MLESRIEHMTRDPLPARAAALKAAALVGVPAEALEWLRGAKGGDDLSAREWLRRALEAGRAYEDREAA